MTQYFSNLCWKVFVFSLQRQFPIDFEQRKREFPPVELFKLESYLLDNLLYHIPLFRIRCYFLKQGEYLCHLIDVVKVNDKSIIERWLIKFIERNFRNIIILGDEALKYSWVEKAHPSSQEFETASSALGCLQVVYHEDQLFDIVEYQVRVLEIFWV